jgi:hypothetical protein
VQLADDAAHDLLAVFAAVVVDELGPQHGDIGRMGNDPVEGGLARGVKQVARAVGDVLDAIQPAVELGEVRGAPGDVKGPGVTRE